MSQRMRVLRQRMRSWVRNRHYKNEIYFLMTESVQIQSLIIKCSQINFRILIYFKKIQTHRSSDRVFLSPRL
jgi:hypothetical protein